MNFSGCASPTKANTAFKAVSSSSFRGDIRKAIAFRLRGSLSDHAAGHGAQDPAHLCRGCQVVFPFRRERTVLLQVRWRNMERSLAKEKGDVYLDTYQTAPWNARLVYRMVLNDPMLSVSIHLKPANRPEKIKWRSISGPILVISISKRGNTSTWEIPLKDGHQNRSKSVVLVAASLLLLCKWLELPQKLPSVPGKAWSRSLGKRPCQVFPERVQSVAQIW